MEAYSGFAQVYDLLMQDFDYDAWVEYIEDIFKRNNIEPKSILELACGTGNITNRLAAKGYSITGLDMSTEMLTFAKNKALALGVNVDYINQNMLELDYSKKVDCVLCLCDGFNYILDKEELDWVFKNIYSTLNKGGIFIFDISSYYKISKILGNNTFAENLEEVSYIWENYYEEENNICESDLTIFLKKNELFEKIVESHDQRAYKTEEIVKILKKYEFSKVEYYNGFTFQKPSYTDQRVNFVCIK